MSHTLQLLGMRDASAAIGVSKQYLNRAADLGKIRCFHTSSGKIFLKEDVDAFIAQRLTQSKKDRRIRLKDSK